LVYSSQFIIPKPHIYSCNQYCSTPIANHVNWQYLQTFSCLQINQTQVIEITQQMFQLVNSPYSTENATFNDFCSLKIIQPPKYRLPHN